MATGVVKSFQGNWQQMVDAVTAEKICIGKDNAFARTINITHEDGSVKRFAAWFFEPMFKRKRDGSQLLIKGYRLLIFDKMKSENRVLGYFDGESENGYGKIVTVRIFPLSAIVPQSQLKITPKPTIPIPVQSRPKRRH